MYIFFTVRAQCFDPIGYFQASTVSDNTRYHNIHSRYDVLYYLISSDVHLKIPYKVETLNLLDENRSIQ